MMFTEGLALTPENPLHDIYMVLICYLNCFLHLQVMQMIVSMVFKLFKFTDKKCSEKTDKFGRKSEKVLPPGLLGLAFSSCDSCPACLQSIQSICSPAETLLSVVAEPLE